MPLRDAVEYVAAAYIVVFAIVLIYLTIMSRRLKGVERDLEELTKLADERQQAAARPPEDPSELDLGRPESTVA